jgi:hypothetical protein
MRENLEGEIDGTRFHVSLRARLVNTVSIAPVENIATPVFVSFDKAIRRSS